MCVISLAQATALISNQSEKKAPFGSERVNFPE